MSKKTERTITRSKQLRREALKSIVVGGGAVAAIKTMPEQWAKPLVNSLIIPSHAQTSASDPVPLTCEFTASSELLQQVGGVTTSVGTFNFPGAVETFATGDLTFNITAMVTPGVSDNFTLSAISNDIDVSAFPQNSSPDSANGQLNFVGLSAPNFFGSVEFTITPDVSSCGAAQTLTLTLSD